jgi:hypothetical protein
LISREKALPPLLGTYLAALIPGDVGGEIFDVDLPPGSVGGELVEAHAAFLEDQDRVVTAGGQRGLDGVLVRLSHMLGHNQQPLRGLADLHAARALPSAGIEVCAELTADSQIALDLAQPTGETARIGVCRLGLLQLDWWDVSVLFVEPGVVEPIDVVRR